MSIKRAIMATILVLVGLTVSTFSQADETAVNGTTAYDYEFKAVDYTLGYKSEPISPKDLQCLAQNIYYESRGEPTEGKVAVGVVTLNRVADGRFRSTICDVVHQRDTRSITKDKVVPIKETVEIQGWIGKRTIIKTTYKVKSFIENITTCQFSWSCNKGRNPKEDDPAWIESLAIARDLLQGGMAFIAYTEKYSESLFFHATSINPRWGKQQVGKVGNHVFYK